MSFDYASAILGQGTSAAKYRAWLLSEIERVDGQASALQSAADAIFEAFTPGETPFPYYEVLHDLAALLHEKAGVAAEVRLSWDAPYVDDPGRRARQQHAALIATGHPKYQVGAHVYRYFDSADRLLYVGYTQTPQKRNNAHAREKDWYLDVVRWSVERFETEQEARAAEAVAIIAEAPMHNKAGAGSR